MKYSSLKVRDFMKKGLDTDIGIKRKEIRLIKKEIRYIEDMKKCLDDVKDSELEDMIKKDEKAYSQYLKMSELLEDKQKKEIQRMVKEGKLKEIFEDEQIG